MLMTWNLLFLHYPPHGADRLLLPEEARDLILRKVTPLSPHRLANLSHVPAPLQSGSPSQFKSVRPLQPTRHPPQSRQRLQRRCRKQRQPLP
jgi:hypothetical protein